jgi:CDP-glucose 4,6-dehydratase
MEPHRPGTIRPILWGERPVIRSDGSFIRDYVHGRRRRWVLALAEAAATRPAVAGEAFNFAADARLGPEIVDASALMDPTLTRRGNDAVNEITERASPPKAHEVLGWRPLTLGRGARATVDWYPPTGR